MRYFTAAIVAMLSFILAGCNTVNTQVVDNTVQTQLPKLCSLADVASAAFMVANVRYDVADKYVRMHNAAKAAIDDLCDDPKSATAVGVLITVSTHYDSLLSALKGAQQAEKRATVASTN